MVDQEARAELAEALRRLVLAEITNEGPDAIPPKVHPFVGRALSFLQSDREYEWPQDAFGIRPATGVQLICVRFWLAFYILLWLAVVVLVVFENSRKPLFLDVVGLGALTAVVHLIIVYAGRRERRKRFHATDDFNATWPFRTPAEVQWQAVPDCQ